MSQTNPSRLARCSLTTGRLLLGLVFFVVGLDGFVHVIPQPTTLPSEGAMTLFVAFLKSGYMLQLIAGTELVAGALLLANRMVPLALVLVAPVIVNILAFHVFLEPSGLVIACALVAIELALAWAYRSAFRPLFAMRAT